MNDESTEPTPRLAEELLTGPPPVDEEMMEALQKEAGPAESKPNRKQRRARRKLRGIGWTRQHSSKRVTKRECLGSPENKRKALAAYFRRLIARAPEPASETPVPPECDDCDQENCSCLAPQEEFEELWSREE